MSGSIDLWLLWVFTKVILAAVIVVVVSAAAAAVYIVLCSHDDKPVE